MCSIPWPMSLCLRSYGQNTMQGFSLVSKVLLLHLANCTLGHLRTACAPLRYLASCLSGPLSLTRAPTCPRLQPNPEQMESTPLPSSWTLQGCSRALKVSSTTGGVFQDGQATCKTNVFMAIGTSQKIRPAIPGDTTSASSQRHSATQRGRSAHE